MYGGCQGLFQENIQNSSGNLKILPGIRRVVKFFQETQSNKVKFLGSLRFYRNAVSQNFRTINIPGFLGGFLSTHGSAQTAFVRAVTPC